MKFNERGHPLYEQKSGLGVRAPGVYNIEEIESGSLTQCSLTHSLRTSRVECTAPSIRVPKCNSTALVDTALPSLMTSECACKVLKM